MSSGWIKLHRQFRDSPYYKESTAKSVWLECLLRAAHEDDTMFLKRQKITLKAGQFCMGREEFGRAIGVSGSTVWYWILQFEADNMVDIKKTTNGSIVSVKNWLQYQTADSNVDNKKTAKKQQKNTNNNVKNEKNVEEVRGEKISPTPSEQAREFFESQTQQKALIGYFVDRGSNEQTIKNELQKFIDYWTELNKSGSKQRWETEKTFEVKKRLKTWFDRTRNFTQNRNQKPLFTTTK